MQVSPLTAKKVDFFSLYLESLCSNLCARRFRRNSQLHQPFLRCRSHPRNGPANKPLDHSDPPRKLQSCILPYSRKFFEKEECFRPNFWRKVITRARYRPGTCLGVPDTPVLSVSVHVTQLSSEPANFRLSDWLSAADFWVFNCLAPAILGRKRCRPKNKVT